MRRSGFVAGIVALLIAGNLFAADSPQVQALKQQIKTLRSQRDATTHAIRLQYDSVINQTKQSEAQLAAAKKNLAEQETQIGALGSGSAQSQAMQENMETLRKAMRGEIKMDNKQIAALRVQRDAHIKQINTAYDAKIKELEATIKSARAATPSTSKPKK